MRRPVFIAWTGLVLGEAAALVLGKPGLFLPVLVFIFYALLWYRKRSRSPAAGLRLPQTGSSLGPGRLAGAVRTGRLPGIIRPDRLTGTVRTISLRAVSLFAGRKETGKDGKTSLILLCFFMFLGALTFLAQGQPDQAELLLDQAGRLGDPAPTGLLQGQGEAVKKTATATSLLIKKNAVFRYRNRFFRCSYHCRVTGEVEDRLCPGDRVVLTGRLQAFDIAENPGEFPARDYYYANGIRYSFRMERLLSLDRPAFSPARLVYLFGRRMADIYTECVAERERGVFKAMVLGDKSELSEEGRELYEENGVAHLLAISGLHVSVVGGWIFKRLRKRGLGYGPACLAGGLVLACYGTMVGFGSSVTRATVMYLTFLLSQYYGADYDVPSSLALAGSVLLLSSPLRIKETGSILSFASVFAVGLVWPWARDQLADRRKYTKKTGELRPGDWEILFRTRTGLRQKKGQPLLVDRARDSLAASLVISMVTMPLILRFFYGWSPYSIFLNLLVLPAMMPVLLSALAGGLAGSLLSFFSRPAAIRLAFLICLPAELILRCFSLVFEACRSLPFSYLLTGCPSLAAIFFLYGLEAGAVWLWYRRSWRGLSALAAGLCLVLVFKPSDQLRMTMLSVGQGECILLALPDGRHMMIDGGSSSRQEIGSYVIRPALKYYGISRLDYLVITHTDDDHISGVKELLQKDYPVTNLLLPEMGEAEKTDDHFQEILDLARARGVRVHRIERGRQLQAGRAIFYCLSPWKGLDADDRNAYSVVLYLKYGAFDALFTGDLEGDQEEDLVCWMKDYERETGRRLLTGLADGLSLLKVAHHGSSHSSRRAFLAWFGPKQAVISAGRDNRYGHPHRETIERLEAAGVKKGSMFATLWGGAIELETDGLDSRLRYWRE